MGGHGEQRRPQMPCRLARVFASELDACTEAKGAPRMGASGAFLPAVHEGFSAQLGGSFEISSPKRRSSFRERGQVLPWSGCEGDKGRGGEPWHVLRLKKVSSFDHAETCSDWPSGARSPPQPAVHFGWPQRALIEAR